jgi:hypothetical protein
MKPSTRRGALRAAMIVGCAAAATTAGAAATSFFQRSGDPTVYRVSQRAICAVTGTGQLALLGGTGRVQPAPPALAARLQRGRIPSCPWPDGFYRRGSERTVHRVQGNTVCAVVGEGQLERLGASERSVRVVGARADLAAGKRDVGTCPWPNGFYRYAKSPQVYRIQGATICQVRNEAQLRSMGGTGAVQPVGARAQLASGKRDLGACR